MLILDWIQNNLRNDFLDFIMPLIAVITDNGIHWIILGLILFIIKKYRIISVRLAAGMFYAAVIGLILKYLFDRVRPCAVNIVSNLPVACPDSPSFPSGHTTMTIAGATILYLINKKWGYWAYGFSVIVMFSRLYLYAHYPSDLLAGIAVGVIAGVAGYITVNFIYSKIKIPLLKKIIPNNKFD